MKNVTVITPSRIHLALIDLNGSLGRVDSGIGLSISHPGFKIVAERANETEIIGMPESVARAQKVLMLLREKCPIGHAAIDIQESIPPHVGLGCGTQLSLGLAQSMCRLYGVELSHQEMAFIVERGGTSGIGVAAFSQGGFILDGGHKYSTDTSQNNDLKTSFLPSSASSGIKPPPVLARYDFPNWDVLIAIPDCKHISGAEEVNLFQTLCPLDLSDVQALSHIILIKLLPAIVQQNLLGFGEAIDQIQNIGWKKVEIEKQDGIVRQTMHFLKDNGAYGVGLSSWGPAIFCFGENLKALETQARSFFSEINVNGTCILTRANNVGAVTVEEDNGIYGSRFEAANLQRAAHQ